MYGAKKKEEEEEEEDYQLNTGGMVSTVSGKSLAKNTNEFTCSLRQRSRQLCMWATRSAVKFLIQRW